ncbi:MAG: hypothetical protein KDA68_07350 [Planctomycetaceae bacterium]|nr:hypothetical protein [Planctomycetaceae bacterium]
MRRASRSHTLPHPEQLELRILPTVKVNFNPNSGLLKITWDNAANRIDIEGLDTGKVEVFIDLVLFDSFEGVKSIKANLKGGDDELQMSAVRIDGSLNVKTGSGADEVDMDDNIELGSGTDTFNAVGLTGKFNLGGNVGDRIDFDDAIFFGKDVVMTGVADVDLNGDGVVAGFEVDDIVFFENLTINLSGKGDVDGDNLEVDIDNVVVFMKTNINGSNASERIQITQSAFAEDFKLNLDDGDDVVRIDNGAANANLFGAAAIFNGGDDNDTLFLGIDGIDNGFADPPTILNFETVI